MLVPHVTPKIIVYDLDGTLCPHGGNVEQHVAELLRRQSNVAEVHICTASTIGRTRDRIKNLIEKGCLTRVWCGHGTSVLDGNGEFIKRYVRAPLPDELLEKLNFYRNQSTFKNKGTVPLAGDSSCYSFSILGKRFTPEQRYDYLGHAQMYQERFKLVSMLRAEFPAWNFYMGGQTGIDIVPKGFGKDSVIKRLLTRTDKICFIGDDFRKFGGDESAADYIESTAKKWNLDTLFAYRIDGYDSVQVRQSIKRINQLMGIYF